MQTISWNGSKPPAFLFYAGDFLTDEKVELMTTRQIGAYLLLLLKAWHQDPVASVPDDDGILRRWARLDEDEWQDDRDAVMAAWVLIGDRWFQKRLLAEAEKFAGKRSQASKAAASRWQCGRNADASIPQCNKVSKASKQVSNTPTAPKERPQPSDQPIQPTQHTTSPDAQVSRLTSASHPEPVSSPAKQKTPYKSNVSVVESQPDGFDQFWAVFPSVRKTAKRTARLAWARAIQRASPETIIEAAREYAASPLGQSEYAAGPMPWLNGDRWEDDRKSWQRGAAGKSSTGFIPSEQIGKGFENGN